MNKLLLAVYFSFLFLLFLFGGFFSLLFLKSIWELKFGSCWSDLLDLQKDLQTTTLSLLKAIAESNLQKLHGSCSVLHGKQVAQGVFESFIKSLLLPYPLLGKLMVFLSFVMIILGHLYI